MDEQSNIREILVLGKLPESSHEYLERLQNCYSLKFSLIEHHREQRLSAEQTIELLKDKFAVVSEPIDIISEEAMAACPNLSVISNRAVGFDNVDLRQASSRGIIVCNTPGVLDSATADLTMGLLLACARRIPEADAYVRSGQWQGFKSDLLLGPDIENKQLGIIGMGRIGEAVARRARAFGMDIVYTRAASSADEKDSRLHEELEARKTSLEELLETSHFISLHCPLTENSRSLIGAKELSLMRKDAILINTARGKVIDQEALIDALESKRILGAALDVFEEEPLVPERLKKLDNVVLTPHIGSACIDTRRKMAEMAIKAIVDAARRKMPEHCLNPEIWAEFLQARDPREE